MTEARLRQHARGSVRRHFGPACEGSPGPLAGGGGGAAWAWALGALGTNVSDHGVAHGRQVPHPTLFCCHAIHFVVEMRLTRQEETAS
jgi:hypothetical protein